MKKLFFSILGLLFLLSCQKNDIKAPPEEPDNPTKGNFQEWWNNRIIDENTIKFLLNDPQFTTLCDSLNKEIMINRLQQGEQIDSIIKNYPLYLYELINYGTEHNIPDILLYKNHYLKSLYPKTKEIIVEGACLLKDSWITAHHTCTFAYEVGYNIYRARGCCEYRFRKSIQESMIHLPQSNYNIMTLYSYVSDPFRLNNECEYYVDLLDMLGIPKYERKNRLLELDNNIEEIIMAIAQNPQFWASCNCTNIGGGDSGGGGGGGEGEGGGGGGGIGGGSEGNQVPPSGSMSKSIFNKTSMLTSIQWDKVENALIKILDDCLGSQLMELLRDKNINILYDDKIKANGIYNHENNQLTIKDFKEGDTLDKTFERILLHELLHCAQPNIPYARLNLEIEVYVAMYRYAVKNGITLTSEKYDAIRLLSDTMDENYNILDYSAYNDFYSNTINVFQGIDFYKNYTESYEARNFNTIKELAIYC